MARDSSPALDPGAGEPPTSSARLRIAVQPWGMAEGTVPPDQAHLLITIFGILSSASSGIGGAVLTVHVAPNLTTLAYAELALAFVATVFIGVCGLAPALRKRKRRKFVAARQQCPPRQQGLPPAP